MPPPLAAFLTTAFIIFLYRREAKANPNVSSALWIPCIWMFMASSRGFTDWVYLLTKVNIGGTSLEEGSPIDRLVFIALIGAGVYVLRQRNFSLARLASGNQWLTVFLIYSLLAVIWSDFPFVALKRWIKVIGHPIMVLVVLTEPDPKQALITLMKRCAYIVLPVSILFIKYYPQYGRGFSVWTGAAFNTGISGDKNGLGVGCLIYGFFFVWHMLNTWLLPRGRGRRDELLLCAFFLWMTWWLSQRADSQTPFIALCLGVSVMILATVVNKHTIGTWLMVGIGGALLLEVLFDAYEVVLSMLGRDATLTDRTLLWSYLLKMDINPILGEGFESFWLGDRLRQIWTDFTFGPNQAHNGYLETYLNLGGVGVILLLALLAATYAKSRHSIVAGAEFGRFRLGFLAAIIVYNWTEAAFKTTHLVFFVFYIIAIDYTRRRTQAPGTMAAVKATPTFAHAGT